MQKNEQNQQNDIVKTELENGVRIISEKIPGVRSVSTGIWVGTGSRHEKEGWEGISHFIEHLMFKGTKNRSAVEIAGSPRFCWGTVKCVYN